MIFVTVGTNEQPFNRLILNVDEWKRDGIIKEDVIMQIGYSTYKPKYCRWNSFFSHQEMMRQVSEARIVVTHGGPASFIMPLQIGKIPIVLPREKKYGEHVNDHQVYFVKEVSKRYHNILVANDTKELKKMIVEYNDFNADISGDNTSNQEVFNYKFAQIVRELMN